MDNISPLSLQYLTRVLRLRWTTALAVSLLFFAGAAAYVLSLRPAYTSTAVVLLAAPADELVQRTSDGGSTTDAFFIRSEADIVASDELSRAVVNQLKLWMVPEFQPHKGLLNRLGLKHATAGQSPLSSEEVLLDEVGRYYKSKLSVFNDGRSQTVEIAFTSSDPRLAATIANAHADAYLQEQSARRLDAQQKAIKWLAKEVDARAADVRDADAQVQQYQLRHGIVSTNETTMVEQRLSQLSTQLIEARRQLSTQSALLAEIRQIRAGGDAGTAATLLTDESLKSLLQSRVEKEASVATLEKRLTPNHPTLLQQRQELASINNVLNTQLQRLEGEATSNASWWQKQVEDLNDAVTAETSAKVGQDRAVAGLPALAAQATVKRAVFEAVLNRYQMLLAERGFSASAASVVSRAVPSARPSFPKTTLFLVIAAMVSMLGGTTAAIAVQLRKRTSMGLTPMADALGIRPLGAIPRVRNASRVNGAIQMKNPGLFVESIRFLRDAILERQHGRQTVTCLLTSVLPRQGKSLVAMSLARAIARAGRKTLFLEIDLRQPTGSLLARQTPPENGIVAVLENRVPIADAIVQDESTGLEMLLAEKNASAALDRLTSLALRHLLAKLRARYDAIVIDSPPVGIVSDALIMTSLVDQTIVVAKDGDSSIADLKHGVRLLQERSAMVAGLVLTNVDPSEMSFVDQRTLQRYVMGVPAAMSADNAREKPSGNVIDAPAPVLHGQRLI